MGQETFARPASMQMPSRFARPATKEEIMRDYGLSYWFQTQRRIPLPWPTVRTWAPGALIANLPAVIQTGAGVSGPTRGMLPQLRRETEKRYVANISDENIFALDSGHSGQDLPLPPRGTGLIAGTARTGLARGLGGRLTELQRRMRHTALRGQAQAPLAEQPQRTREEPYYSQLPILNAIRTRFRRA